MSNSDQYVICLGNAFDGMTLYGPYSITEATEIATSDDFKDVDWNIVLIRKPEELKP